jgi:hypothetical protein
VIAPRQLSVLVRYGNTHIAQLSFALGIQRWSVDLPRRDFALYEELMVAPINDGRPIQNANALLIPQPGELPFSGPSS